MCDVIDDADLGEPAKARLESFLERLLSAAGVRGDAELCVRVVEASEMQTLNRDWRGIDAPTDVLSFPAGGADFPLPKDVLGDIVVCLPVVRKNAEERGADMEDELRWAVTHGLLHLLGWDHPDDEALEKMEGRTFELLSICCAEVA
ncbi:MAG: rRNA maturation RNase YbeY [bacterium]|jgi:probable rRNA maturation factor